MSRRLVALRPDLLSEAQLSALVVELARIGRWRKYHTWSAKKSPRGFPDWILIRDGRMVAAELKSEKGPLRPEQREWLDELDQVPGVEAYLWRPSDWDLIVETLTGRKPEKETPDGG